MLKIPSFIAVGYRHLHGNNGLINLFKINGFTVVALECPRETLVHEQQFVKVIQELKAKVQLVFSPVMANDFLP